MNNNNLIDTFQKINIETNTNIKQAYIYSRISAKNYTVPSIEVQEQTLIDFCNANNIEVIDTEYDIGKSASNMNNLKNLNKILNKIKKQYKSYPQKLCNVGIIFYDVSRFSRNTFQALKIIDD